MRIRDVEQRTGLSQKTIHFNEAKDTVMDQVRLGNDLPAEKPEDLLLRITENSCDDPDLISDEPEEVPVLPCIGIDIGTTTISAVVLDIAKGKTVGVYTLANASDIPSEFVWEKTQDVEQIIGRIDRLLDSLLHRYAGVKAIGITGQMHGILYIDAEGNAVSPLYTWQDERAGLGSPSFCQILEERTGLRVAPGYGLATHFANQQNGNVPDGAVKLCTVMDYIVMKLTGHTVPLTHSSDAASLGFFNIQTNVFDHDAIVKAGIDPSILPDVTSESMIAGTWNGIPVSVAIGDNQASFLGSVRNPECEALANFGTGSQISVMNRDLKEFQPDTAMEIRPFTENSWLTSGSALCGGRAYALLERFFRQYMTACGRTAGEQYEVMNALAQKGLECGRYLHVHTTFCGTRNDPALFGSVDGISEELFTPEAFIAGTLWGMAAELHEMFRKMPHDHVNTLVVSGNAVRKNPALRQMLKEVFAMDVCMPSHKEEAAFGAAMFSAMSSGCAEREKLAACIGYSDI